MKIDWDELYPLRKLKAVSASDVENALASKIEELIGGLDKDVHDISVSIHQMEFLNDLDGKVKMVMTVRTESHRGFFAIDKSKESAAVTS